MIKPGRNQVVVKIMLPSQSVRGITVFRYPWLERQSCTRGEVVATNVEAIPVGSIVHWSPKAYVRPAKTKDYDVVVLRGEDVGVFEID